MAFSCGDGYAHRWACHLMMMMMMCTASCRSRPHLLSQRWLALEVWASLNPVLVACHRVKHMNMHLVDLHARQAARTQSRTPDHWRPRSQTGHAHSSAVTYATEPRGQDTAVCFQRKTEKLVYFCISAETVN